MTVVLLIVVLLLLCWDVLWWGLGVTPVFPGQLQRLLQAPNGERPVLLDVRTQFEYDLFHIQGAVNAPAIFRNPQQVQSIDRDTPIVVICMSGHRSPIAAYFLRRQGYKNVSHLVWGMLSWVVSRGSTVSRESHAADQHKPR